jgi:hypothetical protein
MTNLDKAIKIVNKRLPNSYLVPIKTYKTIYSLLRGYCRMAKKDYNEEVEWYAKYKTNPETNTYMKTKYWRDWTTLPKNNRSRNHRNKGFAFSAIAYNPILIAEGQVKSRTVTELVFLIIHEFGHHWLDKHGYDSLNERWCDEFAIRWTRKMIKEGLIS